MMAALVLARAGLRPIIIERGKPADIRKRDVEHLQSTGILNTESNVQFGEGGAGTFSDGKLTTGTHDPRIRYVIDAFVRHGAPEEISYSSKPHIGTDLLVPMVQSIRNEIISLGGEYRFCHMLIGLDIKDKKLRAAIISDMSRNGRASNNSASVYELPADHLILAIGHSARDTFDCFTMREYLCSRKLFQPVCALSIRSHLSIVLNTVPLRMSFPLPTTSWHSTFRMAEASIPSACARAER
jgi:uncharacterized FAD-dependent dehydrogenase